MPSNIMKAGIQSIKSLMELQLIFLLSNCQTKIDFLWKMVLSRVLNYLYNLSYILSGYKSNGTHYYVYQDMKHDRKAREKHIISNILIGNPNIGTVIHDPYIIY